MLATDIDGTLLGDPDGELLLKDFLRAYSGSCTLAVISGRSLSSVQALIDENRLPRPAYIGSSVGTELCDCNDPANLLGQRYAARVVSTWDLEKIYTIGEGKGIRRQMFAESLPRFQAGFDWDGQPSTLDAFRVRLAAEPGCYILPSSGRYIDVFPHQVGKGKVVQFLQQALGLDPERIVVAGDTGNDSGLFETHFKGIVPVNVLDELKGVACQPWHYHSSYPAARGVLDGLCHFGFVMQR